VDLVQFMLLPDLFNALGDGMRELHITTRLLWSEVLKAGLEKFLILFVQDSMHTDYPLIVPSSSNYCFSIIYIGLSLTFLGMYL